MERDVTSQVKRRDASATHISQRVLKRVAAGLSDQHRATRRASHSPRERWTSWKGRGRTMDLGDILGRKWESLKTSIGSLIFLLLEPDANAIAVWSKLPRSTPSTAVLTGSTLSNVKFLPKSSIRIRYHIVYHAKARLAERLRTVSTGT